ncbi:peroxin [Malassezia sp. CBS 17886]|nr:peroxin [Malassezia sp. CBS 17886]
MSMVPAGGRKWLRRGLNVLAVATGLVGGLYFVAQFALLKFNEMQERLLRDRVARENLRRRYLQNQEDCSFTIMALLPTLSTQIFSAMDVEATTKELQQQSRRVPPAELKRVGAGPGRVPADESREVPAGPADRSREVSGVSDNGAREAPGASAPPSASPAGSAAEGATRGPAAPAPPTRALSPTRTPHERSASQASTSGGLDRVSEDPPPPISMTAKLPRPEREQEDSALSRWEEEGRMTKLQLWSQIKLGSFERTFTTLYTVVFLALQTHIQLNMIGRRNYLMALESQARRDDRMQTLRAPAGDMASHHHIALRGGGEDDAADPRDAETDARWDMRLSHETEKKYLTSSYWFLHRGWRHVAEQVRRAVHAELAEMPLKTILTFHHFEALVQRIRARIGGDSEGATGMFAPWSADGFRNILLPESAADEVDMMRQAGALSSGVPGAAAVPPQLREMLDETKDYVDSPDFARTFDAACDEVFAQFLKGMAPAFGVHSFPDDMLVDPAARSLAFSMERPLLLAKLLPLVSQQAQVAMTATPNAYVEAITECKELRAFTVLIYTAWDDEVGP